MALQSGDWQVVCAAAAEEEEVEEEEEEAAGAVTGGGTMGGWNGAVGAVNCPAVLRVSGCSASPGTSWGGPTDTSGSTWD